MITTVAGNYPKIPDLPAPGKWRTAAERFQKGQIDKAAMDQVEDEVTLEAIADQVEAGIDLITDGQIRWDDTQTYFARKLSGFSINGLQRYFDTNIYYREPVAEAEVSWTGPITVGDYEFARAHSRRPVKAVITGPFTLAALSRDHHYRDRRAYVQALADALNQEVRALQAAGAQVVQIDEPAICRFPEEYETFADAVRRVTHGVSIQTVLCTYFGDIAGMYPQVLDLPVDVIGLDFVAGYRNWDALDQAPFTKSLACGILDARNTRLESVDELVSAIRKITALVPPERVLVSPSAGLEFLPRSVAKRKLERLVEATRAAGGTLQEVRA